MKVSGTPAVRLSPRTQSPDSCSVRKLSGRYDARASTPTSRASPCTTCSESSAAPPGYTVASLGAGATRLLPRGPFTVDLTLRNVLDVRYRSFMSRYKAFADGPGRGIVLRVGAPI